MLRRRSSLWSAIFFAGTVCTCLYADSLFCGDTADQGTVEVATCQPDGAGEGNEPCPGSTPAGTPSPADYVGGGWRLAEIVKRTVRTSHTLFLVTYLVRQGDWAPVGAGTAGSNGGNSAARPAYSTLGIRVVASQIHRHAPPLG